MQSSFSVGEKDIKDTKPWAKGSSLLGFLANIHKDPKSIPKTQGGGYLVEKSEYLSPGQSLSSGAPSPGLHRGFRG